MSDAVVNEEAPLLVKAEEDLHRFPPEGVTLPRFPRTLELLVLLYCTGYAGVTPLVSQYVYLRASEDLSIFPNSSKEEQCNASILESVNSTSYRDTQKVQALASNWMLYRTGGFCVACLPAILLFSAASDAVGRKLPIVLPCLGGAIDAIVCLLTIWLTLPLYCLVASAVICGLTGGIGCLFAGALAYVADTTPGQRRPMRIAVVESLAGFGGALMSLLIGWWIGIHGFLLPQAACTIVYIIALVFSLLLLPEVRQRRIDVSGLGRAVRAAAAGICSLIQQPKPLPILYSCVFISILLFSCCFNGTVDLTVLFLMNYPLCLDSQYIGYFVSVRLGLLQIGMLILVHLLHKRLSTLSLAAMGVASAAFGFALMSLATNANLLLASAGVGCLGAVAVPMYRAFTSLITPAHLQGSLFSLFGVLQMSSVLLGDTVLTIIYKRTLLWFPGFVFALIALCLAIALLFTIAALVKFRCSRGRMVTYSSC